MQKMTFGRKDKQVDTTTIVFNSHLTLGDIPLEACDYVVNDKPAIERVMERYQVTVDNPHDKILNGGVLISRGCAISQSPIEP